MKFVLEGPQIAWLLLALAGALYHVVKGGKSTEKRYGSGEFAIKFIIWTVILFFGGFFTEVRPL